MIDRTAWRAGVAALFIGAAALAGAQTMAPAADTKTPAAEDKVAPAEGKSVASDAKADAGDPVAALAQLSWLEGCWRGTVNQREFREHWLPLRGGLLVGASQTVLNGKTLDYEYLRIEPRADGLYYVTATPGQKESAFRLAGVETPQGDTLYTFANPAQDFPQKISYRRSTEGWLYATVEGKVAGADRQVIYPMRRIGCESGELIKK